MKTTRRTALGILGSLPAAAAEARGRSRRRTHLTPRPPRLGIIYPFTFTPQMKDAILGPSAWNTNGSDYEIQHQLTPVEPGVNPAGIQTAVKALVDNNCTVLASVGGLVVHQRVRDYLGEYLATLAADDPKRETVFLSIVGRHPASTGQGGRSGQVLHGWQSNADRVTDLRAKLRPRPPLNQIALYRMYDIPHRPGDDSNPPYRNVQELDKHHFPAGAVIDYYSGSGPFVFPDVRGLVISQHPWFLSTLYKSDGTLKDNTDVTSIVVAANAWAKLGTGTNTRHVVYPLREYDEAVQTLPGADSSFHTSYGPKLYLALRKLGKKARAPSTDPYDDEQD